MSENSCNVTVLHGYTHQLMTNTIKNIAFHDILSTTRPCPYAPEGIADSTIQTDRMISNGYNFFHDPTLGTNGISCDMNHPDASHTHPETYPKFQTQIKKISFLRDLINLCIINPREESMPADDDQKMRS